MSLFFRWGQVEGQGWGLPYQKGQGYSSYILRVKRANFINLRVVSLKKSTVVLLRFGTAISPEENKNSSHAYKTVSRYLLGVLFKSSVEQPLPLYMRVPPSSCGFHLGSKQLYQFIRIKEPVYRLYSNKIGLGAATVL